eukprot:1388558-Rhodomonas_salina.1
MSTTNSVFSRHCYLYPGIVSSERRNSYAISGPLAVQLRTLEFLALVVQIGLVPAGTPGYCSTVPRLLPGYGPGIPRVPGYPRYPEPETGVFSASLILRLNATFAAAHSVAELHSYKTARQSSPFRLTCISHGYPARFVRCNRTFTM